MLKTLCFDYAIREKWYINLKSLEGKNFFKLLLMLSLSDALFGIVCILAFASTWLLIPAAPWRDYLEDSFCRFNWTLSRMMGMGGRNNAVCIIGYELIISKNFIFLKIYQRSLRIFSFWLSELVLRVDTLTQRLACIGLKNNLPTSCCILIGEWSTCFLEESYAMRVHTHLMNNDISVSPSHKFFWKLWIALEIHVSSLTSLAF